jgi:antitoxin MazE
MKSTIQKWGNSQGIRLPKIILDNMNWSDNEVVEIIPDKDKLIIKKARENNITEYLESFYNKDINTILKEQEDIYIPQEYDWGKRQGKELW